MQNQSIEYQRKVGTLDRNQAIVMLHKSGISQAELGRWFGLSRERVRQIIQRKISSPPLE